MTTGNHGGPSPADVGRFGGVGGGGLEDNYGSGGIGGSGRGSGKENKTNTRMLKLI